MSFDQYQVIYTLLAFAIFLVLKLVVDKIISSAGKKLGYHSPRIKIMKKIVGVILFILLTSTILLIWGVDKTEFGIFLTSLLTVVGVAFFAQWSILSNITSSLIIFFNHPVKIGDRIAIQDKEFPVEGRVSDIGIFFLIVKTDQGDQITIPSNVFMQKMIKKVEN